MRPDYPRQKINIGMNNTFEDDFGWDNGEGYGPPPDEDFPPNDGGGGPGSFRNRRYRNAYGNYRGGYGPDGGFGPPPFGPPGPGPTFGPMPGPRPLMWGRGFGPEGPPVRKNSLEEKALRYLTRCGVSKENLKNLPRQLLQLIQPTFCGLCAISLESFQVSRMHYISKNHLKNQKKWLAQQSELGFHRSKELPVKARELYCELCDVHITSKSHAESHYAGKPHRAIVEGRKMPRNPFLLQKQMEGRLEMLIRREKKFLKAEKVEVKEAPVENKPIQPELYCEICKTSVTCSEQMTMHLNGKRHLAKEKQHILKMMKGDANTSVAADGEQKDGADDENENEAVPEEMDQSGKEEENQGDGQDGDDWGNGSGTWDETTDY